jgi:hypothetical protein
MEPYVVSRFDVALSFPGEHRAFVEAVAVRLSATFGNERVLYDKYYEAEFARPNLDVYLPGLYRTQSELIVRFLCPEYAARRWCNLEWRHIRSFLATMDEAQIMFLRYGFDGDLSELGILPGDGTIDFKGRSPEDISDKIIERFKINGGRILISGQPSKEITLGSSLARGTLLRLGLLVGATIPISFTLGISIFNYIHADAVDELVKILGSKP